MASPSETATVEVNGHVFTPVTEGSATILFPDTNEVFYNPVQQFNRDMSIAAIKSFISLRNEERAVESEKKKQKKRKAGEEATDEGAVNDGHAGTMDDPKDFRERKYSVLEALSATGLRAIRYAKEIDGLGTIIANDISESAVENIRRNVEYNGVEQSKVVANHGDATAYMFQHRSGGEKFDVIDLDPYGSASPFIDTAVQAVSNGGLLCVTCTDLAVLAGGGQSAACWNKYGSVNVPNAPYTHEMALRIVLHALQSSAARYKRIIVPLVSCSIDFYVRLFVRVFVSPEKVKEAASKSAMIFSCSYCRTHHMQPIGKTTERSGSTPNYGVATGPPVGTSCEICGNKFHIGGPFYSAPLHDKTFVARMLAEAKDRGAYGTRDRMIGMLTVISEELDMPFSYSLSHLAQAIHSTNVSLLTFTSALLHGNYRVSLTHTAANCIKTDAPPSVLWDIMRCWVKLHPVAAKRLEADPVIARILGKEPEFQANFSLHPLADPPSRKIKLVRFQENPPDWGPKARAQGRGKQKNQDGTEGRPSKRAKQENAE